MAYGNLRDGDAVVTDNGLVFYVFGYDHPSDRYHCFLKYVPEAYAEHFNLDWLDVRWHMKDTTLVRPTELYSPEAYSRLLEAFRRFSPEYLHFSHSLDRWMITVPRRLIAEAFLPSRQLMVIMRRGASDPLEERAVALVELLSGEAGIPLGFFGVHGSISLGIHHEGSDIDLTVYGASNYRKAKYTLMGLERKGLLSLKRANRIEGKRLNRGIFRGIDFVANTTRRFSEITKRQLIHKPLGPVEVECRCTSAEEAMFRPAVYRVEDCKAVGGARSEVEEVSEVVSMIGLYRDIVVRGEMMRACGILEEVTGNYGCKWYRIVVGSVYPGEYLDWLEP